MMAASGGTGAGDNMPQRAMGAGKAEGAGNVDGQLKDSLALVNSLT